MGFRMLNPPYPLLQGGIGTNKKPLRFHERALIKGGKPLII